MDKIGSHLKSSQMNYSPIGTRGNAQTGIRIMCRVLSLSAAYAAAVLSCPFYGVTPTRGRFVSSADICAPIYRARLDAACRELAALLLADVMPMLLRRPAQRIPSITSPDGSRAGVAVSTSGRRGDRVRYSVSKVRLLWCGSGPGRRTRGETGG